MAFSSDPQPIGQIKIGAFDVPVPAPHPNPLPVYTGRGRDPRQREGEGPAPPCNLESLILREERGDETGERLGLLHVDAVPGRADDLEARLAQRTCIALTGALRDDFVV